MERIKGANGELMKYSMQPMDGEGHLTLYRYDQLAVGGADNAHLEFWQEIEELRKQLADAKATIAALQARVRELEDGTNALLNQQSERLAAENEKLTMALSQLTQRTAERDTARRRVDELEARERELEEWVQDQSTANLETMRHTDEMQSRALEAEQQLTRRTAELERVRGERDEYAHKTKMLCLQNGPLMIENHDMKKLIAALPKVEVVTGDTVVNIIQQYNFHQWMLRALKHRQGMEG